MDKIEKSLEIIKKAYEKFHKKQFLFTDPVKFLHRYSDERDVEVAGFISAVFAYGRVEQIFKTLETIFSYLGDSPYLSLVRKKRFSDFPQLVHRFNSREDIIATLEMIGKVLRSFGSFERLFMFYYKKGKGIKKPLDYFANVLYVMLPRRTASLKFLFPFPSDGSACKRWNLFLRWMVRKDEIDRGIWKNVLPSDLVIPLDTHVWKISKKLGLTERKIPDWQAAEEVTEKLKLLDPTDPVKYDFAITRAGMLEGMG